MQPEKKKILFLTGTRADFGKLKPLIEQVESSPAFETALFVTGMHMLARYGYTLEEIQKVGFKNIFTYINQIETCSAQMDLVLANTIQGLGYYVREFPPNLIVLHGDRVEALAGAIVGSLNNIRVAHIEGGELSGTIDGLIRHSVTKLSHLHFVSNEEAEKRLRQMGESPGSIFVIGSPDIDIMLSNTLPTLDETRERYHIPFEDYMIFIYHPVTTEFETLSERIQEVVAALRESRQRFVVIYPNNDSGSDCVFRAIQPLAEDRACFRLLPSMRFEHFLTLLKNARAIVGNSSAGIREAPVYGVPTINVGSRQSARFSYASIFNIAEERAAIVSALVHLPARIAPSFHFGNGRSAELFLKHLQSADLWSVSHQKQFVDLPM